MPKSSGVDRWEMEVEARTLGITLEEAIEEAHPNASACELTNIKILILHNGSSDALTQIYLQQQLQRRQQ